MTDRLGEALACVEEIPDCFEHRPQVLAAARAWHALTNSKPRQLWSWSESGNRRVMKPGRFYVVPVDALTVTAEADDV